MLPVGNPAIGDDFIDREKEIELILTLLKKDNVLLIAPRKFGKTSIMRRLEKKLSSKGEITLFIDVEAVDSPQMFLIEMLRMLIEKGKIRKKTIPPVLEKLLQWLSDNIVFKLKVPLFEAELKYHKEDWSKKADQVFAILNDSKSNIYFMIDEFPIAIKRMDPKDAETFLHWFRKLRQQFKNLRFIIGGSVSNERVVKEVCGVSVINDFEKVQIGGFTRDVALDVIKRCFNEKEWNYEASIGDKILNSIGEPYIPYFIAIILSAIEVEHIMTNAVINDDLIEYIYTDLMYYNKYFFSI